MSLFKILKGDSSRIGTSTTPFHEGYAYFTPDDGGLYIDSVVNDEQKRVRVTSPGSGSASVAVTATLLASGWQSSQQRIAVSGLGATQNGIVGITQSITDEQLNACLAAGLFVCNQEDGYLTIAASGDTPTYDIPVLVILLS